jgi:hypothetical protein
VPLLGSERGSFNFRLFLASLYIPLSHSGFAISSFQKQKPIGSRDQQQGDQIGRIFAFLVSVYFVNFLANGRSGTYFWATFFIEKMTY